MENIQRLDNPGSRPAQDAQREGKRLKIRLILLWFASTLSTTLFIMVTTLFVVFPHGAFVTAWALEKVCFDLGALTLTAFCAHLGISLARAHAKMKAGRMAEQLSLYVTVVFAMLESSAIASWAIYPEGLGIRVPPQLDNLVTLAVALFASTVFCWIALVYEDRRRSSS